MSTSTGKQAEEAAAKHLTENGYKVIDRNWRRPRCEIDLIAIKKRSFRKPNEVFFVEVKYRKRDEQGSGLEYITPKKLEQMKFAAEMWVNENKYNGDYELSAIEVTGSDFRITHFEPRIDT